MVKVKVMTLLILNLLSISIAQDSILNMIPIHLGNKTLYIDKTEVTQAQFDSLFPGHRFHHRGCNECPAERVTYQDAVRYCTFLGKRLPTQAEFEYAARGGLQDYWSKLNKTMRLNYAWLRENSHKETHPVATLQPNPFGLYDMVGNAKEWTSENRNDIDHHFGVLGIAGLFVSSAKTIANCKGGSFDDRARRIDINEDDMHDIDDWDDDIGFRCVKDGN